MLFQRGKRRLKRRHRVVTCTAAALTHFFQVKDGFAAGEGPGKQSGRTAVLYQNLAFGFSSLTCCFNVGKPLLCLLLCWPRTAVVSALQTRDPLITLFARTSRGLALLLLFNAETDQ